MLILVINSGSSSLKYQLFDTSKEESIVKGLIEQIGSEKSYLSQYLQTGRNIEKEEVYVKDHYEAFKIASEKITCAEYGIIENMSCVSAIGHRVVHGADKFKSPVIIDDNVLKCIKENSKIAPLHNPPAIKGIEAVKKNFPDIIQVAVFDTSFHQTMPEKAYIYGLPYELYEKYNLRKYGFHGTSHKFVALQAAKKAKKSLENLKIITCHLGNGCSITAVKDGKSIDTSMGFTPLEGLLMGTRCGDIDPAIVYFLMEKEKFDTAEIDALLNKKSGLLGVSGISNDVRQVEDASKKGNKRAKLALDLYIYKISKYIGSYYAIMEGLDIVVFTAGVGENQENIRNQVISQVKHILDKEQAEVMVIPTNEELMIAKETEEVLRFANK